MAESLYRLTNNTPMLLGFKRCFSPYVKDGSKTHTIRHHRKKPPRVGETCHCYVDPRRPSMKLLGRWPCVAVDEIVIRESGDNLCPLSVTINGGSLECSEIRALFFRDGFRGPKSVEEARAFWRGALPFIGQIIHWRFQ